MIRPADHIPLFLEKKKGKETFTIIKIGLERDRDELYDRINLKGGDMLRMGLEEEAGQLYKFRQLNALNSVGYREVFDFFDGKINREKSY